MQTQPSLISELIPLQHRTLILQMIRRDLVLRYRGSVLGLGWSVVSSLLVLGIYTVVFHYVIKARWGQGSQNLSMADFALNLYAGLVIFNWFADCLGRAPRLIMEQPNLVTKIVFPLPVLGWSLLLSSAVQMMVSLTLLAVACAIFGYHWSAHTLLIPVSLLLFMPWLLALVWLVASIGVYVRDLAQVVPIVITAALFLSPVLYPSSAVPHAIGALAWINPLAPVIETLRMGLLQSGEVNYTALVTHGLLGFVAAGLCLAIFRRLSRYFSDVL